MKQSRKMSGLEAATNTLVGFLLALALQVAIFPNLPLTTNIWIVIAFTLLSLARSYVLRRLFERLR